MTCNNEHCYYRQLSIEHSAPDDCRWKVPTHPDGTTDMEALARSLTADEVAAMEAEMEHLEPHAGNDAAFECAALSGRCYCVQRFICTRCKLTAEKLGSQ